MKKLILLSIMLHAFRIINAQSNIDLTGKTFQQVNKIPNGSTEVYFNTKTEVIYTITSIINGKTFVDRCTGKAIISGNKISIKCLCDDKEIYPDPIEDSFIYDSKSKKLTSTSYRSTDGVYFIWNLK